MSRLRPQATLTNPATHRARAPSHALSSLDDSDHALILRPWPDVSVRIALGPEQELRDSRERTAGEPGLARKRASYAGLMAH
jgi:hypothetical protein